MRFCTSGSKAATCMVKQRQQQAVCQVSKSESRRGERLCNRQHYCCGCYSLPAVEHCLDCAGVDPELRFVAVFLVLQYMLNIF